MTYGGYTTCFVIHAGNQTIIIDGGSGLVAYEPDYLEDNHTKVSMLISHVHTDHINGIPMFEPFNQEMNEFVFYSETRGGKKIEDQLKTVIGSPFFPIAFSDFKSQISYCNLEKNTEFYLGKEVKVNTISTNHPNDCTGFKITYQGKSIVTLVDHEHTKSAEIDRFVEGCDLLVYDAYYTPEDFKLGWGHSTWKEGLELAKRQGVKQVVLSHHNQTYSDCKIQQLDTMVKKEFPRAEYAKQGRRIVL